ncbi:unnamed protein product [Spirodela intermedia]|uniref:Uncharacterized protein n=1 Tax=Spirodela intermedia TaxID=51605 RepID=A0A7I8J2Y3_SPIIN|nr:unnamed protein product [Spirodela intermedia]CAA6664163.1 unnamed protein product [Spirodela intermedia]
MIVRARRSPQLLKSYTLIIGHGPPRKAVLCHVVSGDKGVVDGDELYVIPLQCDPYHQAANPTEPYSITANDYEKFEGKGSFKARDEIKPNRRNEGKEGGPKQVGQKESRN